MVRVLGVCLVLVCTLSFVALTLALDEEGNVVTSNGSGCADDPSQCIRVYHTRLRGSHPLTFARTPMHDYDSGRPSEGGGLSLTSSAFLGTSLTTTLEVIILIAAAIGVCILVATCYCMCALPKNSHSDGQPTPVDVLRNQVDGVKEVQLSVANESDGHDQCPDCIAEANQLTLASSTQHPQSESASPSPSMPNSRLGSPLASPLSSPQVSMRNWRDAHTSDMSGDRRFYRDPMVSLTSLPTIPQHALATASKYQSPLVGPYRPVDFQQYKPLGRSIRPCHSSYPSTSVSGAGGRPSPATSDSPSISSTSMANNSSVTSLTTSTPPTVSISESGTPEPSRLTRPHAPTMHPLNGKGLDGRQAGGAVMIRLHQPHPQQVALVV